MGGKGVKKQIINSFGPLGKERVERLRVGGSRDKLEDAVIGEHPPLRSQGREGSNGDAARRVQEEAQNMKEKAEHCVRSLSTASVTVSPL